MAERAASLAAWNVGPVHRRVHAESLPDSAVWLGAKRLMICNGRARSFRALLTDGAAAGHLSRVDLILAVGLAAITLAVCLYFAPRGFQAGFVDMGQDGYQLRQVLDLSRGSVIFRDTFDQYGPLNGYLNTVGFLALGGRLM